MRMEEGIKFWKEARTPVRMEIRKEVRSEVKPDSGLGLGISVSRHSRSAMMSC